MIPNFIVFEDADLFIPDDFKSKFKNINWSDQLFTTFSICETSMSEYEISEDEIFLRFEDRTIEKQDITGKIEFSTVIPHEEDEIDYELVFKALYFKGELKELNFSEAFEHSQTERKANQEKIMKVIEEQEARKSQLFYKFIKFYRNCVEFTFTFFRYILGSIIKFLWFIQNKIT
jgi:hypothetical protein